MTVGKSHRRKTIVWSCILNLTDLEQDSTEVLLAKLDLLYRDNESAPSSDTMAARTTQSGAGQRWLAYVDTIVFIGEEVRRKTDAHTALSLRHSSAPQRQISHCSLDGRGREKKGSGTS